MQKEQDLQKVLKLRDAILSGDETRLKQQKDLGKLTARDRIAKIADAGSFVELFALVSNKEEGAGVITGYITIDSRPVYLFAQDFTVHGGAMGVLQAKKIVKLLDMAQKNGAPVLALLDSAGVRINEGACAMSAYSEIYNKMAKLSGVCPMVAVVLGPCIGGAALISQLADVTIMAEKVGTLMVYGPQVMAALNHKPVNAETFGGAKVAAEMGSCALTASNEEEAFVQAKTLLSYLPSSNLEDTEIVDGDNMNRLLGDVNVSDVDALFAAYADNGVVMELYASYENSMRVALARMGGRTVGLVSANGTLTAGAMQKAARFVRFMDCYNIPVVSFLNTNGVELNNASQQAWLLKAQSQLLYAFAEATTAKITLVTGDAIGQAYVAMGGLSNADMTYALPGAVISTLTPEAAVAVLYGKEVIADKNISVEDARAKYAAVYVDEVANAVNAATAGMIDDVIEPAQSRIMLISALEMLASKRDSNPPKKHGNIPM